MMNKKYPTAHYGMNPFADLTREEFASQRLSKTKMTAEPLAQSCLSKGITVVQMNTSAIPTSFDWRTKGVVSGVKDQGQCGSCWAFSTIGNIESQYAIKNKNIMTFSEQMLVDCSQGCANEPPYGPVCNQGCDGGWQWSAFEDIITWGGVETETDYPYTAEDGTCNKDPSKFIAKIQNYTCLSTPDGAGANEDKMAAYLVANGPIAIAMNADYLQDYSSGIIDPWFGWECDATSLDHALVIVGYGQDVSELYGTTYYWIVRNSWSATWGEDGYFRIVRGQGSCGLNNAVSAVIM